MRVVATGKVVIYTGTAGTPSSEYRAPTGGATTYHVSVGEITGGASVTAAWWAPYDNIGDITHFSQISVSPTSAGEVALTVGAYSDDGHRMRIMLYVLTT